ncbi:hypothetical protein [Solimicrobium silvestre]|nr:hypothetical protein [Solimicrobium silvestre]
MKSAILALAVAAATSISGCGSDKSEFVIIADDNCGINAPLGNTPFNRQTDLLPWGWAFDKATGTVPDQIFMQIISEDHKSSTKATMKRASRPDVAKAFGLPIDMAGYGGQIEVKNLPAGTYSVSIVQTSGNKTIVCTSPSKIILN